MNNSVEINFDGLVGPSHNYAGLPLGNIASTQHAFQIAHPRLAAIQGLNKMKLLMDLGIPQAVLPPHERPFLPFLRQIGYVGSDMHILSDVYKTNPNLFRSMYSASSMWVANAATVSSSQDTADRKVHITPANLVSNLHRSIEAEQNYQIFNKIFYDSDYFTVHSPLVKQSTFSDEGSANYNRLCSHYGEKGLSIFVYGRDGFSEKNLNNQNYLKMLPKNYPARQTLEASQSIARLHHLSDNTLFLRQNPDAIDAGVFHNDVISVANQNVFLFHELAFVDESGQVNADAVCQLIQTHYEKMQEGSKGLSHHNHQSKVYLLKVKNSEISLKEAVSCFLFNSQIVTINADNLKNNAHNANMALITPIECQASPAAQNVIQRILSEDNPIKTVHYINCRQSMQNGGGPACLRLRVVLNEDEKNACHQNIFLTNELYEKLLSWINHYYRETIHPKDLLDPLLLQESYKALDVLTQILQLDSIYSFQK